MSESVAVQVLSTKEINQLSYQIFCSGCSVEANTVKFENTKDYTLNIKPSFLMIPKAQLVVYYLSHEGEIISDRIEIEFGNELVNYVSGNHFFPLLTIIKIKYILG